MFQKSKQCHFLAVHPVFSMLLGATLTVGLITLCLVKRRALPSMPCEMPGANPSCECGEG